MFDGDRQLPGSVPELRLLSALHHLVLSGHAPQLADHYPSVGGTAPPAGAWAAAEHALADDADLVAARLDRTVQTNEPGRCVSLFGGLLWLAERHRMPIRLLEIGASAGLNLNADRYRYVVGGAALGDPACELAFVEPWIGAPVGDLAGAASLDVCERAGCDPAPIDPTTDDGLRSLMCYVWPDELDRLARLRLAAQIAAKHPVQIDRSDAADWLARRLTAAPDGVLTVVWQSVVRQYLEAAEWDAIKARIRCGAATIPLAWLVLEPGADGFELRCLGGTARRPATAGDRRVPRAAGALERRAGVGGPPPRARRRARDAPSTSPPC